LIAKLPAVSGAGESIIVPDGLANIVIEAGKASDYDHLLLTKGGAHE
jgi:hypothetical protein